MNVGGVAADWADVVNGTGRVRTRDFRGIEIGRREGQVLGETVRMEHHETLGNGLAYRFALPNDIATGVDLTIEAVYASSADLALRKEMREIVKSWAEAGQMNDFAPPYNSEGGFHGPADLTSDGDRDVWVVDMGSALGSQAITVLLECLEEWTGGPVVIDSLTLTME